MERKDMEMNRHMHRTSTDSPRAPADDGQWPLGVPLDPPDGPNPHESPPDRPPKPDFEPSPIRPKPGGKKLPSRS